MSFEIINEERKQHLSLSTHAYFVIQHDMCAFHISHKSTFINHIFENYYPFAKATISISSENYREELKNILTSDSDVFNSDSVQSIIDTQVKKYIDDIKQYYSAIEKKVPFKIKVNKNNFDYLFSDCKEEKHYRSAGQYIKAVIEEYCQKSFLEREEIYARDYFEIIRKAIDDGKKLVLQCIKNRPKHIRKSNNKHYIIAERWTVKSSPLFL